MKAYQRCVRCVMDTTDPWIEFDKYGVCNHCRGYETLVAKLLPPPEIARHELERIVNQIKRDGAGKPYDCIIGVSGGVDSTYVAYLINQLGLRPLAVHLDNGWDSELAVSNIEKVLSHLGIDLHTHVLNWEEFKDLQMAFLRASVPDGEIPTDHAIAAVIYQTAVRLRIKYVVSGSNIVTEGILPIRWTYGIQDWTYIRGIQRKFGRRPLATFPHMNLFDRTYYNLVRKIVTVRILNLIPYKKADVMHVLQDELGWKYYGGKHYESIYTRFFQGYILPHKFGIDKRLAHFSTLICSGQMNREQALEELEQPVYPEELQYSDYEYVMKKFGFSQVELDGIVKQPVKSFLDYPNQYEFTKKLKVALEFLRQFGVLKGNTSL
jgi:N-acetyl sugar amidotransferase